MKKGINAWCFAKGTSAEEMFAETSKAGFDGIELNLAEPGDEGLAAHMLNTETDEKGFEKIISLSNQYGLPVTSISTSLLWGCPLSSSDEQIRAKGIGIVKKMITAASRLSADAVLVVPGIVTEEAQYDDVYARALSAIKELKSFAEEKNIIIAVENVWNKFLLSPLEAKHFLEEIDSGYVKFYFDAGNIMLYGFPHHWVKILGKMIAKIHVKDFDTGAGTAKGFRNLLHGDLNWGLFMKALREIGYDDFLTAELSPYKVCPGQLVTDTSVALDAIIRL